MSADYFRSLQFYEDLASLHRSSMNLSRSWPLSVQKHLRCSLAEANTFFDGLIAGEPRLAGGVNSDQYLRSGRWVRALRTVEKLDAATLRLNPAQSLARQLAIILESYEDFRASAGDQQFGESRS